MRTLVLDPGGQFGVRPGVNATIELTKYQTSNAKPFTGRAAYGRVISGQESELVEIQAEAMVDSDTHRKLQALHRFSSQAIDIGQIPEIVVYDFWEPFTELQSQTRAHVPGTDVISTSSYSEYFVVRAGIFQMETVTYANCPLVRITFTESFKVLYDDLYS